MKVAVISLVLFGIIAAICAAVLIATLARPAGAGAPLTLKVEQDVDVLVAAVDLQPMSVVDSKSVVVKKVPKNQAVNGPYLWMDAVLVDASNVDQMLK